MGFFNKIKNALKKDEIKNNDLYVRGLEKSRKNFFDRLTELTTNHKRITDAYFDELEEILIMSDIGINMVSELITRLRKRVSNEKIESPEYLKEIIVDELFIIYVNDEIIVNKINYNPDGPTVILFIGVNGVGKTTTICKLANMLKSEGKSVLLVAADTFRAGAVEQIIEWGTVTGCDVVGKPDSDPASVIFDGLKKAKDAKADVCSCQHGQ